MAIELVVEVNYEGSGHKHIMFSDLRDTFKEIAAKASEAGIDSEFFKQIVIKMPALTKLGLEQLRAKFEHYFDDVADGNGKISVSMKEIASMDPELERRIVRKAEGMLDNFGALVSAQEVVTGKNAEGKWCVKVVYATDYKPDSGDEYNTYDDEAELRTTRSKPFPNKEYALQHAMFLAGALNIRHVDEDEQVK